jgi:hypothetical protein
VFTISDLKSHPGSIFFVHYGTGTDGAGYGNNPDSPLATLDYAVGLCTAAKGDVIYLLPGHAESVISASTLTLDVAGIKVIGLGWGAARPTFTITTADTATFNITAANVWVENILVVGNFLNIAAAITIKTSATACTLKDVEVRDTSVVLGALIMISVAANMHDLTLDGVRCIATALTAAATQVVNCAGAVNRLRIVNCQFYGACTGAVVGASTAASSDVFLRGITMLNTDTTNGLGIALHNSSTGFADEIVSVNLKNTVKGLTGTGLSVGPNVVYSNAVNAYAGLFSYTIDS